VLHSKPLVQKFINKNQKQLINQIMVYSIPERKFILETYLKTKSYKKVRQLFIKDKMAIIFDIYCNLFFQTLVLSIIVKKIIKLNKVYFSQNLVIDLKLN
jgi:hypothetical protein